MKNSYYFKNFKITKVSSEQMPTSIDDAGTGWIYDDISGMVKPELKKVNGKWQIVESATPEEIAQFQQAQQQEQITNFVQVKKSDGLQYANEVDDKIAFLMNGKTLSQAENLDKEIRAKIISIVQLIRSGDWLTARNYINNRSLPKIPEVRDLFIEVRQTARDYVANKYPNK